MKRKTHFKLKVIHSIYGISPLDMCSANTDQLFGSRRKGNEKEEHTVEAVFAAPDYLDDSIDRMVWPNYNCTRGKLNIFEHQVDGKSFIRGEFVMRVKGGSGWIRYWAWIKIDSLALEDFKQARSTPDYHEKWVGILENELPGYPQTYGEKVLINRSPLNNGFPVVSGMFSSDHPVNHDMQLGISEKKAKKLVDAMYAICRGGI